MAITVRLSSPYIHLIEDDRQLCCLDLSGARAAIEALNSAVGQMGHARRIELERRIETMERSIETMERELEQARAEIAAIGEFASPVPARLQTTCDRSIPFATLREIEAASDAAPREQGWDSEPIVDAPKPPSVSAPVPAPPAERPAAAKPAEPSPPPTPPRAPAPKDSIAALKLAAAAERAPPEVYNKNDVGIVVDRNIATISHGGRQTEIAPRGGTLVYLLARVLGEIVDANFLAKEIYGAATPDNLNKLRVLASDVKSLVHRVGLDVIYQKPVGYRLKRSA